MERTTPLYDRHVAAGGRMVPFAGYLLPVQYTGVIEEHRAVRERAGLFDVSHMGEILFTGPDALRTLQNLFSNDFAGMADGRVRYSPMCNEGGGIVDDMMVYRLAEDRYMAVPNAANKDKVVAWARGHLVGDAEMEDCSDRYAQLALQGPKSREILTQLADAALLPVKYYTFTENVPVAGVSCLVSRTGYTGELGYELYCSPADAPALWDALLRAGGPDLVPCGLGARDTLRLEAGMPLYGHEMSDDITPLEARLDPFVKLEKDDFIGKAALVAKGPPERVRVGLRITGRGIAREHNPVYLGDRVIGETTSGTHLPWVGEACAMALLQTAHSAVGTAVEVEVRGRRIPAEIIPIPFYKK